MELVHGPVHAHSDPPATHLVDQAGCTGTGKGAGPAAHCLADVPEDPEVEFRGPFDTELLQGDGHIVKVVPGRVSLNLGHELGGEPTLAHEDFWSSALEQDALLNSVHNN